MVLPSADGSPHRDARRAQLLDVALVLFGERGFHATSIADIIERAGVARGTFYNYFDSKRQIFASLLDRLFEAVDASVAPIRATGHVHEEVRANIEALCRTLYENLPMARVLLEQAVGLDDDTTRQLRGFYERVLGRLELAIRVGQAMNIVRTGDAAAMAACLLGMVKESIFQQIIGTRTPPLDIMVHEIFDSISRGMLA